MLEFFEVAQSLKSLTAKIYLHNMQRLERSGKILIFPELYNLKSINAGTKASFVKRSAASSPEL
jgi:hypothetical protein